MKLTIDYEPTAKSMPRFKFVNGQAITYYHWKTTEALEAIRVLIKNQTTLPFPSHIPIRLSVTFYRTKSRWLPKRERLPFRKPDLDNFLKWCIDGLSGIAFPDDAQITTIQAKKRWANDGHGCVVVELEEDVP